LASNLKRSKRTVGQRLIDLQTKVSGLQKRVGPVELGTNAVSTASLQPGAIGGWVVDVTSIYTGVKTATGSFAPTGSITIGSDGHITASKFRIDANGNAFFTGAISGGTIDISDFDTSSFHVDAVGQMWLGGVTYDDAPFRVSSAGVLRSRVVFGSGSTFTTTISSGSYRSEFYDSPNNAYALYTIGSTQQASTAFWVNTNSTLDADIREKVVYQTNGIFLDGRSAIGGTYSNVGYFTTGRGAGYVETVLSVMTKNNAGGIINSVGIYGGNVIATATISSAVKFFKIDHPLYPDKKLVHASIEGPTLDVFYRGISELVNGEVEIELPEYFEALTTQEGRTVLLTAETDSGSTQVAHLAYSSIYDGKFKVFEVNGSQNSSQKFSWVVMAIRSDTSFDVVVDNDTDPSRSMPAYERNV
jgi:hypothetical protein